MLFTQYCVWFTWLPGGKLVDGLPPARSCKNDHFDRKFCRICIIISKMRQNRNDRIIFKINLGWVWEKMRNGSLGFHLAPLILKIIIFSFSVRRTTYFFRNFTSREKYRFSEIQTSAKTEFCRRLWSTSHPGGNQVDGSPPVWNETQLFLGRGGWKIIRADWLHINKIAMHT